MSHECEEAQNVVKNVPSRSRRRWAVIISVFAVFAAALIIFSPFSKNDAANMGQSCNLSPELVQTDSDSAPFQPACFVGLAQMSPEQTKLVIETGLQNTAVLQEWELCEAEIWAVIDAQTRLAPTYIDFDRPQVNVYNLAVLEQAARLARAAEIPCAAGAINRVHKARVTVNVDGARHDAVVSDYDVMNGTAVKWPVEYYKLTELCAERLTAEAMQARELPDDFDRTVALTTFDVQLKMLVMAGVTC